MLLFKSLVVAALLAAADALLGCTAEQDCLGTSTPRCLPTPGGAPCTLDYAYNSTGYCACGTQECVALTGSNSTALKQLLVIGDSISLGYLAPLSAALAGTWEVVHAPSFPGGNSNNDNSNWGNTCVKGWLGPNPERWDAISVNHGAHDYAFPDNEHIDVGTYPRLIESELRQLRSLAPRAAVVWETITPVPTNPPQDCVLIPGRLESNVIAYNAAAAGVVQQVPGVTSCDLHKVIDDFCGVGYSTCSIAQCQGPHFTALGFAMLGNASAACIVAAAAV